MSTTADGRPPISMRIPDQVLDRNRWRDRSGADRKIRELTDFRLARLEAEVLAPARGISPADRRLRRIISTYVTLAVTDPGIMPLLSGGDPGTSPPAVLAAAERFTGALREALAEVLQAQDRPPSIDPGVAAQSLLGIIHWGVSSHRAEGRLSRGEAAAQITFLALHGLVSQPPQKPRRPAYPRRWNAA